jgi:hypothetical protein
VNSNLQGLYDLEDDNSFPPCMILSRSTSTSPSPAGELPAFTNASSVGIDAKDDRWAVTCASSSVLCVIVGLTKILTSRVGRKEEMGRSGAARDIEGSAEVESVEETLRTWDMACSRKRVLEVLEMGLGGSRERGGAREAETREVRQFCQRIARMNQDSRGQGRAAREVAMELPYPIGWRTRRNAWRCGS